MVRFFGGIVIVYFSNNHKSAKYLKSAVYSLALGLQNPSPSGEGCLILLYEQSERCILSVV